MSPTTHDYIGEAVSGMQEGVLKSLDTYGGDQPIVPDPLAWKIKGVDAIGVRSWQEPPHQLTWQELSDALQGVYHLLYVELRSYGAYAVIKNYKEDISLGQIQVLTPPARVVTAAQPSNLAVSIEARESAE